MTDLAERALADGHGLRCLYEFGATLGAFILALWERNPRTFFDRRESDLYRRWLDEGMPEPLPDIRPLVCRVRDLPDEVVWQIPHLLTLVQLAPQLDGPGQDFVLKKLIAVHPDLCPHSDGGMDVDPAVVTRMMHALDDRVQEGLGRLAAGPEYLEFAVGQRQDHPEDISPPETPREKIMPVWDKKSFRLLFNGKLARNVKTDADNLILILRLLAEHHRGTCRL